MKYTDNPVETFIELLKQWTEVIKKTAEAYQAYIDKHEKQEIKDDPKEKHYGC